MYSVHICNSCIMGLSDLRDMYTQAQGPSGPRTWVYISGKLRGHVIQLLYTMQTNSLLWWATNYPSQYEANH